MTILKRLVQPLQLRLLEKHMCVACTRNLDKSVQREPLTNDSELVTCQCGRKYNYIRSHRKYRRAIEQ